MLTDVRDIIIIIGISLSFVLLLASTILITSVFIKIRKLVRYIEESLEEITDLRKKIKNSIPKPISSILDGAVTVKTIIDKVFSKKKSNKKERDDKDGK
ncbi:MAG: hypothetical protein CL769_05140 [Chloroflexi bacterium]|nr:hypothetical protein [Chloroflexota bacterium]